MSNEPVTDLDHARYDRDGWMESALTAQREVARLQAEVVRLVNEVQDHAMQRIKAEAEADRLRTLRAAMNARSYLISGAREWEVRIGFSNAADMQAAMSAMST